MNISESILYIYPNLNFWEDFVVEDKWEGQELTWINTEITEPTQAELQTAWVEAEKKIQVKEKVHRMEEINKQLIQLWGTNKLTSYTNFNTIRTAKITELETEFNEIETDLLANYSDTLVDDILSSLFD